MHLQSVYAYSTLKGEVWPTEGLVADHHQHFQLVFIGVGLSRILENMKSRGIRFIIIEGRNKEVFSGKSENLIIAGSWV